MGSRGTALDKLFIREMRADAWIGVYEWEKITPQTLDFNIEIGLDTHRAGASDRIADTIDYGAVIERIRADLRQTHFKLLEALAEHIAALILHDFNATWVKVSIAKIAHLRGVRQVGIALERSRAGEAPTVP